MKPFIIAVDGRSGSGKSTLALELSTALRRSREVSLFHLEDIYPGWNGLKAGAHLYIDNVLTPLSRGDDASWHAWDWEHHFEGQARQTRCTPIVVVEGVGASYGSARGLVDVTVWVEASTETRKRRALERDGDTFAPFWDMWAAQEEQLLSEGHPIDSADIVVRTPNVELTDVSTVLTALAALPQAQRILAQHLMVRPTHDTIQSETIATPDDFDAAQFFRKLCSGTSHSVWLDSSSADLKQTSSTAEQRQRYSVMADASERAAQIYSHRNGLNELRIDNVTARFRLGFFDWLDAAWVRDDGARAASSTPPTSTFSLGWLGYLGYEAKRETGGSSQTWPGPDAVFIRPAHSVTMDHQTHTLHLWGRGGVSEDYRARVVQALEAARRPPVGSGHSQRRPEASKLPDTPANSGPVLSEVRGRDTRSAYEAKVRQAQQAIARGESYEVCLTTSFDFDFGCDAFEAYCAIRLTNPAPYAAFMRLGDVCILSSSPERLIALSANGEMIAEPIKGTAARGRNDVEDEALRSALETSEKDRAENIMIVDLMRNDLLRSAAPESVQVTRLCEIETYAFVHQMVSTIRGRLAPGASRAEAIAAVFPPGSMTGAPKISTMAILDDLEGRARGPYSGAVGFFADDGAAELSVLIRALVVHEGKAHLGVGGAVTSDSVPEAEWNEVQTKAKGVLKALGLALPS